MKFLLFFVSFVCSSTFASAQLKKDGTPDMRYNANKAAYGSEYVSPSYDRPSQSIDYQRAYERNGTRVQGSYHTTPNNTNVDNWSASGNVNPLTNERGSRAQDYSDESLNYGQGKVIQTGPNGGQYYYNTNGNKTYVPKRPY